MTKSVITISRQCGSGGASLAKILAEKLSVPYLDKKILEETAKNSGIAKYHFENADERRTNSFMFSLVSAHYGSGMAPVRLNDIITDDKLFLFTSETITKLSESPCIIVGRCADDILTADNVVRLFLCADMQDRINRVSEQDRLNPKQAESHIKKTDKRRASHYGFYTSKTWGDPVNYDLCINTSRSQSLEQCADIFIEYLKAREQKQG